MAALNDGTIQTLISFSFLKNELLSATDLFSGNKEHLNGFVRVVFVRVVFRVLLLRSIPCTDKAVGCILQAEIATSKSEIIVG